MGDLFYCWTWPEAQRDNSRTMPKKKGKDAPAAPEVNVEELQLKISQLAEDIFKTKDKIEARAKDYADSLSTFDVPYPLTSLTMSDGVLYAGSLDRMVIGIDATAHADRFQASAKAPVFSVRLLQEIDVLCAGTEAGVIQLWNCLTSDPIGQLEGHTQRVSQLRAGAESDTLWSCSHDGTVKRWAVGPRQCIRSYEVCDFQVAAFVVHAGLIYAASWDSTVRSISVATGELDQIYRGHEHIIHDIQLHENPERPTFYTGAGDHLALGWQGGPAETLNGVTAEGKPTATFKGHIDTVFCVHLLVLADFIAELAGETALQSEGSLAGGAPVVNPHISEADLAVLRDPCMPELIIITGSDDRSIRLFDALNGQCLLVLIGHTDAVSAFVVDNGVLYSASYDRSIRSWQLHEALIRIQMRRTLKNFEAQKLEAEMILEASTSKKKKKKKGKKKK